MKSSSVGVGVIGTGMIGTVHAGNLARRTIGARVAAVMDIDQERAKAVAADLGASVYASAEDLIADPSVDAVLIASPDAAHADQTIACIEAGKPALCEKPLATTAADGERVLRAELAAGRQLVQVGFMRVYDRAHAEVYEMLRGRELGKVVNCRSVHINPWTGAKTIDKALVNSLIHDIHSIRWLMGEEIERVFTQWVRAEPEEPRSARFATVQLQFASGAIGSMEWNGDSGYGYEVMVEVVGERGTARSVSHSSPVLRRGSTIAQEVTPNWPERFGQAYIDEAQIWVDSVRSGEPTGPSAWDGYMSLVAAEACLRSTETGLPEASVGIERPALYNPR
ncbi:MAG: Gfo/Idh/MocA family oxidoreductase [Chloroflexi bacterium]|nr:Gfo/Idh/MocA family oxidoreductase [Chloroflexota bacterium]